MEFTYIRATETFTLWEKLSAALWGIGPRSFIHYDPGYENVGREKAVLYRWADG